MSHTNLKRNSFVAKKISLDFEQSDTDRNF